MYVVGDRCFKHKVWRTIVANMLKSSCCIKMTSVSRRYLNFADRAAKGVGVLRSSFFFIFYGLTVRAAWFSAVAPGISSRYASGP